MRNYITSQGKAGYVTYSTYKSSVGSSNSATNYRKEPVKGGIIRNFFRA